MKSKMVRLFTIPIFFLCCDESSNNPASESTCDQNFLLLVEIGGQGADEIAVLDIILTPIPGAIPTVTIGGDPVNETYRDSSVRWEGWGPYQPSGEISYSIANNGEILSGEIELLPKVTSVTVNGVPVEDRVQIELPITSTLQVEWDGQGASGFSLVYKEDGNEVLRGYHVGESYTQPVSNTNIGSIYFYITAANRGFLSVESSAPDNSSATMCARQYVEGQDFRCEVAFVQ